MTNNSIKNIEYLASRFSEIVDFEKDHENLSERLVLMDMESFLDVAAIVSFATVYSRDVGDSDSLSNCLDLVGRLIDSYESSIMELNHGQTVH